MTAHIGGERQLFLDDHVIGELDGLERVMQRPSKLGRPVLEGGEPWERSTAAIIGNSLHHDEDEGLFKAWYDTAAGVAYATSQDGLQWEKPRLGILEHEGSRANNLVSPGRNFSVVKDPRADDPAQLYKAMYWHSRGTPMRPGAARGTSWRTPPMACTGLRRRGIPSSTFATA